MLKLIIDGFGVDSRTPFSESSSSILGATSAPFFIIVSILRFTNILSDSDLSVFEKQAFGMTLYESYCKNNLFTEVVILMILESTFDDVGWPWDTVS